MMIAVQAELAACVFVCEAKASARMALLEAIGPEHFAQAPCADWWREAKRLEAEGEGPVGWNVLERLISAKASVPASPDGWRGWWLTIREQAAGYLERGRLDENRFEQEVLFYLEKMDVTEERVRLRAHLAYFQEIMEQGDEQGKKLGFIAQEIGREVNTLGSKANDAEIQRRVVGMKDELEKIKEQVLNVM